MIERNASRAFVSFRCAAASASLPRSMLTMSPLARAEIAHATTASAATDRTASLILLLRRDASLIASCPQETGSSRLQLRRANRQAAEALAGRGEDPARHCPRDRPHARP